MTFCGSLLGTETGLMASTTGGGATVMVKPSGGDNKPTVPSGLTTITS